MLETSLQWIQVAKENSGEKNIIKPVGSLNTLLQIDTAKELEHKGGQR